MQKELVLKTKWKTLNSKLYVNPIVGDLQQGCLEDLLSMCKRWLSIEA